MSKTNEEIMARIAKLDQEIAAKERSIAHYKKSHEALVHLAATNSAQITSMREDNAKKYAKLAEIRHATETLVATKASLETFEEKMPEMLRSILAKHGLLGHTEEDF